MLVCHEQAYGGTYYWLSSLLQPSSRLRGTKSESCDHFWDRHWRYLKHLPVAKSLKCWDLQALPICRHPAGYENSTKSWLLGQPFQIWTNSLYQSSCEWSRPWEAALVSNLIRHLNFFFQGFWLHWQPKKGLSLKSSCIKDASVANRQRVTMNDQWISMGMHRAPCCTKCKVHQQSACQLASWLIDYPDRCVLWHHNLAGSRK